MNNTTKLAQLIQENPELPVIPVVDCGAVEWENDLWFGCFGDCKIEEFCLTTEDEEDELCDFIFRSNKAQMKMIEKFYLDEEIEDFPWQKAIFVHVQ